MAVATYTSGQLNDERWKRLRDRLIDRMESRCQSCAETHDRLHVHHTYYVAARAPWEYPDWSLEVLCPGCHSQAHDPETSPDFEMLLGSMVVEKAGRLNLERFCELSELMHDWIQVENLVSDEVFLVRLKGILGK